MTDITRKMAFLLGMKFKQVRKRLNKSLEETASSLNISIQELNKYESGSLDVRIDSLTLMELFKAWGATYKDVFFYQILNKKSTQEIFDFYKNQENDIDLDYVEYLLIDEPIETKKILEKKIK